MKYLFFDSETHRFGPGNMAPKTVCFSFCTDGVNGSLLLAKDSVPLLKAALAQGYTLVAHNAAYDISCILQHHPELSVAVWQAYAQGRILCTAERERLLDIAEGIFRGSYNRHGKWVERKYSLEACAQRYLGIESMDKGADGWRLRYAELDGVPISEWPKRAVDYATDDAVLLAKVFMAQETRAARIGYTLPTQALEARSSIVLRLISCWGMRTDEVKVRELESKTREQMDKLAGELREAGLLRPKWKGRKPNKRIVGWSRNMTAIKSRVVEHYPGEVPRTEKGAVSTAKTTLEDCDDPVLKHLVEWARLQKSLGTFVVKLWDGVHQPIHARFNNIGAESSRTSCADPNLQQLPRLPGVRECFVPPPGHVFINCDFDTQELRCLAQSMLDLIGHSKLARRFQENPEYDGHQEFADSCGSSRQHAKIVNFGIPGGMGVPGLIAFARGFGQVWTEADARWWIARYHEMWPDMQEFFDVVRDIVGPANYGTLIIPRSGFRRGGCSYTEAANGMGLQTLAAHSSKQAAWEVGRRCYDPSLGSVLYGCRVVNFMHDELMLEAPEPVAAEAAVETQRVMCEAMGVWTPDIPVRAEATLSRYWSKDAEVLHDEKGRLVAWPTDGH